MTLSLNNIINAKHGKKITMPLQRMYLYSLGAKNTPKVVEKASKVDQPLRTSFCYYHGCNRSDYHPKHCHHLYANESTIEKVPSHPLEKFEKSTRPGVQTILYAHMLILQA